MDASRAKELGQIALAGMNTPECEWAVQELVEAIAGETWTGEDAEDAPRRVVVAVDPKLVDEAREAAARNAQREAKARAEGKIGYARDIEAHFDLAAAVLAALEPKD